MATGDVVSLILRHTASNRNPQTSDDHAGRPGLKAAPRGTDARPTCEGATGDSERTWGVGESDAERCPSTATSRRRDTSDRRRPTATLPLPVVGHHWLRGLRFRRVTAFIRRVEAGRNVRWTNRAIGKGQGLGEMNHMRRQCEGAQQAHRLGSGGSIPASSLHFWFNEVDAATDLVQRFHYSRRWPSNVQLVATAHVAGGLFGTKGEAVAACVLSIPGTRWSVPVLELSRLVRRDDAHVPLSSLIAATIRKAKKLNDFQIVVSFADWTQKHHGGVYQACGWKFAGLRGQAMDGVLWNGQFVPGRSANSRWGTRSPKRLLERGITAEPHYDEGKYLYWTAWGKGVASAQSLGLESLPYPKPDAA
jgi:hypothetical protein